MQLHQQKSSKGRLLLISVFLLFSTIASLQDNVQLELKVEQFISAKSFEEQYDALADLMEYNANVTLDEASHYYDKFKSKYFEKKDYRYPLLSDFIIADVLYYNDQADSAMYHYLLLSSAASLINENMLAASGLGNAAYVLSDLGDKLGAINLLKGNRDISKATGDIRDLSDHTFSIARNYADLEIRDSAIHYFEKTIDIDRRANNISGMLYNIQTLLDQYLEAGQISKADILCKECISSSMRANENRALAACHYYSGICLFRQEKYSQSKEELVKAIEIDYQRNDATRMSRYHRGLGNVLQKEGAFDLANQEFKKAISSALKNNKQEEIITSYLTFSKALGDQSSFVQALEYNELAEEAISMSGLNAHLLPLYQNFVNIYWELGKTQQAFEYAKKESDLLKERLYSQNLISTDQSAKAYDLFKMENINKTLHAEKLIAGAKLKRRNTLLLSGGIISFLAIFLIYLFSQIQRQRSRQEAQALKYEVLEKEMSALRSQMNPHFLFNSLSSINDYILHENPRLASKYLTKFSQLMRTILNNSREKLITLSDELNAATLYVEMEKLRFKESFEFTLTVDENIDLDQVLIPSMLIQPFMENAIKHGLRNSKRAGVLCLDVKKRADQLEIKIEDNGIGREEAMKLKRRTDGERKSLGMHITKDRIDLLNKIHDIDAGAKIIDKEDAQGTIILLRIKLLLIDSEKAYASL